METKLELKHLAAYLPYELKVKFSFDDEHDHSFVGIDTSQDGIHLISPFGDFGRGNIRDIKPILRPLSDLKEEIEHNGEKFCPARVMMNDYNYNTISSYGYAHVTPINYPYRVVEYLFSLHFDIFNLIEKGLAVPLKTPPHDHNK